MESHVCPVWVGYFLASPIRRLYQNPYRILGPHVKPGMVALDVGCAMGFFSIPMAKMVGPDGRVVCVDLQPKMLESLEKRARKAGVWEPIETRACSSSSLKIDDLNPKIDFALAFAVLHEVPDAQALLSEIGAALVPGADLLLCEPKGQVSPEQFEVTVDAARKAGLTVIDRPAIRGSRSVLLQRPDS